MSRLLLAVLLAMLGTLLAAGPASADGWPLDPHAAITHDHHQG